MSTSPMLTLRGLSHRFAFRAVVKNIDLCVQAGECVALVGPSGCGKTTLLNVAGGLITPTEGHCYNGFVRTAMMFQEPRLLPWRRTLDNIALGLKACGMRRDERLHRAAALALDMGLSNEDFDQFPSALSGGMRSRVALARGFAIEPDLLLLDEAFSALDIGLKSELYRLLTTQQERHGCAVLMITHDLLEAVRLADRILVMSGSPGHIVAECPIEQRRALRDEAWVFERAAALIHEGDIRQAFDLPATA